MQKKILDIKNQFSKLTFKKVLNLIKLFLSYNFSKLTGKEIISGLPCRIAVEPTNYCNLSCPECPSGNKKNKRGKGYLDVNMYNNIIKQQKNNLWYLIVYFQGEPYLNKGLFELIRIAHFNNIYTLTSTNGHFLNDENAKKTVLSGLDKIIISIDGTTQDIYSIYRIGGSLNKVLEGTKNLIKHKTILKSKKPYIIIQFLVFKHNEHQINDIKLLTKDIGADEFQIKTAQIYNYKQDKSLIPNNIKYSRYIKNNNEYFLKKPIKNKCMRMWFSSVITWDGNVVPCCFDKNADFAFGNLKEENFNKIWKNQKYNKFRYTIFKKRNTIDICCNCIE